MYRECLLIDDSVRYTIYGPFPSRLGVLRTTSARWSEWFANLHENVSQLLHLPSLSTAYQARGRGGSYFPVAHQHPSSWTYLRYIICEWEESRQSVYHVPVVSCCAAVHASFSCNASLMVKAIGNARHFLLRNRLV
jgi:hypothetical protein